MKTFKKVMIIFLAIILLLVIISFFLPRKYKVERSINMIADRSLVFNLVSHFNKWDIWIPWTKAIDSTAVFELIGNDGEVGSQRKWTGNILKNGEITTTKITKDQLFGYELSIDNGKFKSFGTITIEPILDSLKVTWVNEGDLGYNPINRYFGLLMDKMMGPDFVKGLEKLKKIAEERNQWPRIEEKMMPEQIVLLIRDSAEKNTYGAVLGRAYGEIKGFINSDKLTVKGFPFAIYQKWDSVTMSSLMDIGIPVEKAGGGKGRIRVEKVAPQKVVIATYFGPYDKTASVYYALDQYMKEGGLQQNGGPWEIYVTDPMKEKDPMKVQTDILFPVK
jgi:effector-binding domain-containing protein